MAASFLPSYFLSIFVFLTCFIYLNGGSSTTRHYKFNIRMQNVTRLCGTKSIITVNGKFPGPRVVVREGDRLVIKVVNHVSKNITIHWHGVRQLQSAWADGPAYITQCPIQPGQSYVYSFTISGQIGTLWYHAHISWIRATLYGPIIILPKRHKSNPFVKSYKEVPIIFGEWWKADPEAIIKQAIQTGAGPNNSDTYTINGFPGPSKNCSANETYRLKVKPGKTYLLRLINAALNDELFFRIANHTFIVVDTDASYVKPFKTHTIYIAPGQTINVLLNTNNNLRSNTKFLMAARPYSTAASGTFDNTTVIGVVEYDTCKIKYPNSSIKNLHVPPLPQINATRFVANWESRLRSLGNAVKVPQVVERRFLFTLGLGTTPCPKNQTCQGPTNQSKFAAGINNVSFVMQTTALLHAHYVRKSKGVYTADFPTTPLKIFFLEQYFSRIFFQK